MTDTNPSPIDGEWRSNLGSTMDVRLDGVKLSGTYTTHIGTTKGTYPLSGFANLDDDGIGTIGWTVVWKNADGNQHGVTTWTGQVQVQGGNLLMETTWLYVTQTVPSENWDSLRLGFNLFTQVE